ncbi:HPP family-domain-containing protein [Polychytrium aggregatum]|uniref:HPP family-domain-containing protein n=1 Tax=Polychytrium aggregatum TaxID=110093 RepID=UPI0022FDD577|nr:HPP family-domain-containing protein [Polychytrium aggregatum]KAI9201986.1 HPP family-domain-containing protein [Polychytrium aggregatum]
MSNLTSHTAVAIGSLENLCPSEHAESPSKESKDHKDPEPAQTHPKPSFLSHLPTLLIPKPSLFFRKLRPAHLPLSDGEPSRLKFLPPSPTLTKAIMCFFGPFLAIWLMCYLNSMGEYEDFLLLVPSFGASVVLLFAAPNAPFSQPRNLIGGQLISGIVGIVFNVAFGPGTDSVYHHLLSGLAVGISILLMMLTGTVHPPGGATALYITRMSPLTSGTSAVLFLFFPVLIGDALLFVLALLFHNVFRHSRYPEYYYC